MDIALTNFSIQMRLSHDSFTLNSLMRYVQSSFKNVKYYSNATVIRGLDEELVKMKYMLQWAYKIYRNNQAIPNDINYQKLSENIHLPVYIFSSNYQKNLTQTLTLTIEHLGENRLLLTLNQQNLQVKRYLKNLFRDSITTRRDKNTFIVSIFTKHELMLLKELLSTKKIYHTKIEYITYSLNFKKLNPDHLQNEQQALEQKLQKCYKILNIDNNSTSQEIKNNYKKMLKKYHPDRVYAKDKELFELYTKRFQVIQKAYEIVQEHHKVA